MRYLNLGNSELSASVIGLGTFEIGGSSWWDPVDQHEAEKTIRYAIDRGINFIDTAPVYGFGHSEQVVGAALQGIRANVLLCTKVGEEFSGWNEGRFRYRHDGRSIYTCLTPRSIRRQLEDSLRNLRTSYIDVYMPHFFFDDPSIGRAEDVMDTLLRLVDEGLVRAIGFSNLQARHLQRFAAAGASHIACVQVYTNILDYDRVDHELIDSIESNGIAGVGINCLAKGLLAGAFADDYVARQGSERSESVWFQPGRVKQVNAMLAGWTDLKAQHNASSAALSLAWVLRQSATSHLLVGATSPQHIEDAVRASEIPLSLEDARRMEEDASALRENTVTPHVISATRILDALSEEGSPVAIWGAGVTLDYLVRRLPLQQCRILAVFDSNPELRGQSRLGCPVEPLTSAHRLSTDTTLIVAIPQEPALLNRALEDAGVQVTSVIHLGHLKALCK